MNRSIVLAAALLPVVVGAAEPESQVDFATVWKQVRERSPALRAAGHELEAARIEEKRLSRHWYPRAFAEGRVFSTNDPAMNFMSVLGQRQLTTSDFSPQALNQPGSHVFERATLGLDFPLFEGGSKTAAAAAASHMAEARSFERGAAELGQYAELATLYSTLLSLREQRRQLESLARGVDDTLSRYKIGVKSNPVGYSGLLGLKNLKNRLEGLLQENAAKTSALKDRVRICAGSLPESWAPRPEKVRSFIAARLASNATRPGEAPPSVRASLSAAEALARSSDAERARFLPKVGLFGTGDLYGGSRATATSYSAGAYIQWDLFSAPSFGAVSQAEHRAAAAQDRAEGLVEQTRIDRATAQASAEALESNLALMDESARLLEEQSETSRDLFRNGSINALQLVEVLARRADLLVSRTEAETRLARERATLLVTSNKEGVPHEN